jgi:outer membrane receptor protein involved in Fe transport
MIDKVEVITSPSAKYDPEGMAGIINIVLKKGKFEGFNGDLSGTIGERDKYNASANVNYFTGKLNVFSSFSYKDRTRSRNGGRDYARKNDGEEMADSLSQHSDTEMHFIADAISIGGDYIINDLNSLSFSYNRSNHIDTSKSSFKIKDFSNSDNSAEYSNVNLEDGINSDFSLTYFKDFEEKGHELSVDVMYADHFDNREMYRVTDGIASDTTKKKEDEFEYVFAVDYVKPLSEKSQLEVGAKATSQKYNQHWKAEYYPYLLDYDESTYAIYSTYGKELSDRFGIQGGLRFESVNISMDLNKIVEDLNAYPDPLDNILYFLRDEALNNGPYSPPNYSKFFPSLHLMYTHNEVHSYKFGYSYRTERPWMRGLNPVPKNDLDDKFVRIGNPNLKPEYTHALEIDHTLQKGRNSLNTSFFYNYSTDLIHWWDSDYIYYDGNEWTYEEPESTEKKIDVMQADNYSTSQRVGFDVTATYFPLPFWFSMVSTSAWYTMLGGENVESDLQGNAVGLYTFFMNRVFLPFAQVELTGNMFGPMKTTDGIIKPILGMNMAIQSSFKNIDVTFKIKNLLDNAGFEIDKDEEFEGYTEYLHAYHYREPRTLMLSLKYSFGKVEESKRKQRKNKNMKRGGGGQDAISY